MGNQTSVTYPDETTVTKTYDEVYNLTKVHDAENKDYLYQYDDAGRVTKLTYPNGWVEDYTYDAEGNLLKTVDTDPFHNNKVSTKFEYRYDAEGNLISEYKRDTTAGNKALTTTYAYDALNRLVSAHEEGVGLNTTRTYDYDTLGNLIRQEEDGCIEYKYNGYALDETTKCGTIPNSIGTSYWEYTYDKRGNLISNDKYTRTTSGMAWQNEESFVYDETNHMVQGTNEQGEVSLYTYNGLGIRVGRELIMKDNTHGYTDFHSQTPSVDTDIDKPEVVKESYIIDYTSPTFQTLVMEEEGGFNYKWVYGLQRLSVKITSEGTNWWGQHVTEDILKDYLHQDRLGSTVNLSDQFGRVVGRADYNEWGEITYREALSISSSYRRIYPQLNYTGYDWDDVLGMYYAKARFYSADDKRFVAMDPVKGSITNPLSLVSYLYCVDNPLRWVDPLGEQLSGASLDAMMRKFLNGDIISTVFDIVKANFNTSQSTLHNIAQAMTGAYLYANNAPDGIVIFERHIASKRESGQVDIILQIPNEIRSHVKNYLFEIKPSYDYTAGLKQLSKYYRIFDCMGETYETDYRTILHEGYFIYDFLIWSDLYYEARMSLYHHGDGVITYEVDVLPKPNNREGKATQNITSSGFSNMIHSSQLKKQQEIYTNALLRTVDDLTAEIFGTPLSKMNTEELIAAGLLTAGAATVVVTLSGLAVESAAVFFAGDATAKFTLGAKVADKIIYILPAVKEAIGIIDDLAA